MKVKPAHDLSLYDYLLPEQLIAQTPANPRDSSRLLIIHRKTQKWEHRKFSDLPEYLDAQSMVVANNTQVLKARLMGRRVIGEGKLGGKVECVLLEEQEPLVWECLFRASAKAVPGLSFQVPNGDSFLTGTVLQGTESSPSGTVVIRFDQDPVHSKAGEMPLPHYIRRPSEEEIADDEVRYQTIYAKHLGSAAAPTAGLHFTPDVMERLREKEVQWNEVTLHTGIGTFRPVKEADIRNHVMHEERFEVSPETASSISEWKASGKKILAVGTTSVRTLETTWNSQEQKIQSGTGRTSLFIRPGDFEFQVVDHLLTNFHLPRSTLLILICAFAGRDLILAAYEDAVRSRYRFFSYGDAVLIL